MADPTLRTLFKGSLRLINAIQAGENPTADDMDVMTEAINALQQSWSNNRLMIYTINQYTFTLNGSTSYTLGTGADWNVDRPMAIENMIARLSPGDPGQLDIAMQSLTDAQYASIAVKNTTSTFPFAFYDDGNYPIRTVTLFPIGAAGTEIVLWLRQPLLNFTGLDDPVTLPPGYERALRFNLAVEVAAEFGKSIPADVSRIAIESKREIERLNAVPRFLKGDGGTIRGDRSRNNNWIVGGYTWKFGN